MGFATLHAEHHTRILQILVAHFLCSLWKGTILPQSSVDVLKMCFDVQVYNLDIVAGVSLHLPNYWHPRNRTRNACGPIDHLQVLVAFP